MHLKSFIFLDQLVGKFNIIDRKLIMIISLWEFINIRLSIRLYIEDKQNRSPLPIIPEIHWDNTVSIRS